MNVAKDLCLISKIQVEQFFFTHIHSAYEVVSRTYLDFAAGKSVNPSSSFLWYNDETKSRIIGLAAFLGDKQTCPGIKWIASCPNNIKQGLPRASAVIVLNDFETGFPIAIIEGAIISALRTALSAILGLEHLHQNKIIQSLGIVGCGFIATQFLHCLQTLGWKVSHLRVYDKDGNRGQEILSKNAWIPNTLVTCSLGETTHHSDVVLFTTTETKPYIQSATDFKPGATVLNLSLRDLGADVILAAYNIVDDIEHVLAANTSPHLAYLESGRKDFIAGSITDLVLGHTRPDPSKLKIFSPMGMGILDIALANLIFSKSLDSNQSILIENFF